MAFKKNRRFFKRKPPPRQAGYPEPAVAQSPGGTGDEASYMKSLVDSRRTVTVVLRTGERLSGRVRYYDRDCFSLGQASGGPNIFLRKKSVLYISEE